MKRIGFLVTILVLLLFLAATVEAKETWPKLEGQKDRAECMTTLKVAQQVYQSDSFFLDNPFTIAPDINAHLIISRNAIDISGGDGIKNQGGVFERKGETGNILYWQKNAVNGKRLVIEDSFHSWRGDTYQSYVIEDKLNMDDFIKGENIRTSSLLTEGTWAPPLVLQDTATKAVWLVNVGEEYALLADWKIYAPNATGDYDNLCVVHFWQGEDYAKQMLPPAVNRFIKSVDATMGSGKDEGTLHPTASLRADLRVFWVNAARRPWAMKWKRDFGSFPYNSRKEVEDSLRRWSKKSKAFAALYRQIKDQYPLAQTALKKYYIKAFGYDAKKAEHLANQAMDLGLRHAYCFGKSR